MKISLIQTSLTWENPQANRDNFETLINSIKEATDIIILPEMFSTGFTMTPNAVAETMDGDTVKWMKATAAAKDCAVTGSLVIEENGSYYNRLLFVLPDGEIKTYDKRHLFSLAGEDKAYTAGADRLIINYRGWKISPFVCYDLRFPVFSRNTEDIDLMLYVANWPAPRVAAWDALLKARAIENMCYVAGVNRTGQDNNGHSYLGHSQVLDELGTNVVQPKENEGVFTVELNKESLLETRNKFQFLNDRDSFSLLR
ncbi:amidohydrolase [Flavobacterium sp. DG1-102-2]|uniref:amidohydrolase n=1 Tax=Flavobacterium sp. DG1-102-2 TaxID=3081663 RepID=UPI002949AB0A|nr:amidohydrolase [Flavobacterium sp. DG1-102-2]MDV6169660.1 amidohydrolase [Flavobacterium sp. DG1-102-2]